MTKIRLIGKVFPAGFRPAVRLSGLLFGMAALLGACSYGGQLNAPFAQKLTWFSLLNGDDIRDACRSGGPERIRLVYNGRYQEQLRVYDLVESDPVGANAGGAQLTAQVQDSRSYAKLGSINLATPFSNWQWQKAEASLAPDQYARLKRSLRSAGLGSEPPVGTELLSTRFYWIAVACLDGAVEFQAWQAPEVDVTRLPFVSLLLEADHTGVPFNAPRPLSAAETALDEPGPDKEQQSSGFRLRVGENGLVGLLAPLL